MRSVHRNCARFLASDCREFYAQNFLLVLLQSNISSERLAPTAANSSGPGAMHYLSGADYQSMNQQPRAIHLLPAATSYNIPRFQQATQIVSQLIPQHNVPGRQVRHLVLVGKRNTHTIN